MSSSTAFAELSEREREALRRLSIFAGSFTAEAAEAVASGLPVESLGSYMWGTAFIHPPPGPASTSFGALLQALTDRGLLDVDNRLANVVRYKMPELARTQQRRVLVESGELHAIQRAHGAYFLAYAEAIDYLLWLGQQRPLMDRLQSEHDDIAEAMAWAAQTGEIELGQRLGASLWVFWQTRGYVDEGRQLFETLLAQPGTSQRARASALVVAGLLAWLQDDLDRAEDWLQESLIEWRAIGGPTDTNRSLFILALVAWRRGDRQRALSLLDEALPLFKQAYDIIGQPLSMIVQAILLRDTYEYDRALALLDEAANMSAFFGFTWGMAAALYYSGEIRTDQHDYDGAATDYQNCVEISWDLSDPWSAGAGIGGLATLAALQDEPETSARFYGIAHGLRQGAGEFLPVVDQNSYERIVAATRVTLGKAKFNAAYAEGYELPKVDAVAKAVAYANLIAGKSIGSDVNADSPPTATNSDIQFTKRELDVVRLLAEGHADKEIGQALGLSPRTISEYVGNLLAKSGFPSRTALAVYAVRNNFV
jgi:DNA-binding CsgD family transcriptional regulator